MVSRVILYDIIVFFMCLSGITVVQSTDKSGQEVSMTLSLKDTTSGRPIIIGKTNLAETTVISAFLSSTDKRYQEYKKTTVKEGAFQFGPFGRGRDMKEGRYVLQLTITKAIKQQRRDKDNIDKKAESPKDHQKVKEQDRQINKILLVSKKGVKLIDEQKESEAPAPINKKSAPTPIIEKK